MYKISVMRYIKFFLEWLLPYKNNHHSCVLHQFTSFASSPFYDGHVTGADLGQMKLAHYESSMKSACIVHNKIYMYDKVVSLIYLIKFEVKGILNLTFMFKKKENDSMCFLFPSNIVLFKNINFLHNLIPVKMIPSNNSFFLIYFYFPNLFPIIEKLKRITRGGGGGGGGSKIKICVPQKIFFSNFFDKKKFLQKSKKGI